MPVVSNTSPILNLAIINRLDLLRHQFEKILIPPVVLDELLPEHEYPEKETIQQAVQEKWICRCSDNE